jgi:hypothetical protein
MENKKYQEEEVESKGQKNDMAEGSEIIEKYYV